MSTVWASMKEIQNLDWNRLVAHIFPGFLLFVVLLMAIDSFTYLPDFKDDEITVKETITTENKPSTSSETIVKEIENKTTTKETITTENKPSTSSETIVKEIENKTTTKDLQSNKITYLILNPAKNSETIQTIILIGLFVGSILGIMIDGIGHRVFDDRLKTRELRDKEKYVFSMWMKIFNIQMLTKDVFPHHLYEKLGVASSTTDKSGSDSGGGFRVRLLKEFYSYYEFYRNSAISLVAVVFILPFYMTEVLKIRPELSIIASIITAFLCGLLFLSSRQTIQEYTKRRMAIIEAKSSKKSNGIFSYPIYLEPATLTINLTNKIRTVDKRLRIIAFEKIDNCKLDLDGLKKIDGLKNKSIQLVPENLETLHEKEEKFAFVKASLLNDKVKDGDYEGNIKFLRDYKDKDGGKVVASVGVKLTITIENEPKKNTENPT